MIDYFFRYATEADAIADAFTAAQKFRVGTMWARDHVLPNVQAWRPSLDTTIPSTDGVSPPTIVHNYLTGWYAIVSINSLLPAILNSTALAFALDRNGPPYVIRNNIGAIISDIACQPIFVGSHYPIGGYSS